jgi:hypothetical protein
MLLSSALSSDSNTNILRGRAASHTKGRQISTTHKHHQERFLSLERNEKLSEDRPLLAPTREQQPDATNDGRVDRSEQLHAPWGIAIFTVGVEGDGDGSHLRTCH